MTRNAGTYRWKAATLLEAVLPLLCWSCLPAPSQLVPAVTDAFSVPVAAFAEPGQGCSVPLDGRDRCRWRIIDLTMGGAADGPSLASTHTAAAVDARRANGAPFPNAVLVLVEPAGRVRPQLAGLAAILATAEVRPRLLVRVAATRDLGMLPASRFAVGSTEHLSFRDGTGWRAEWFGAPEPFPRAVVGVGREDHWAGVLAVVAALPVEWAPPGLRPAELTSPPGAPPPAQSAVARWSENVQVVEVGDVQTLGTIVGTLRR